MTGSGAASSNQELIIFPSRLEIFAASHHAAYRWVRAVFLNDTTQPAVCCIFLQDHHVQVRCMHLLSPKRGRCMEASKVWARSAIHSYFTPYVHALEMAKAISTHSQRRFLPVPTLHRCRVSGQLIVLSFQHQTRWNPRLLRTLPGQLLYMMGQGEGEPDRPVPLHQCAGTSMNMRTCEHANMQTCKHAPPNVLVLTGDIVGPLVTRVVSKHVGTALRDRLKHTEYCG